MRTNKVNPLTTGAVGAAAGAVLGAGTAVLLSNKKTKRFVKAGLENVKDYAQDAFESMNKVADQNNQHLVKIGVKGGRTRKSRKKQS